MVILFLLNMKSIFLQERTHNIYDIPGECCPECIPKPPPPTGATSTTPESKHVEKGIVDYLHFFMTSQ